MGNFSLKEVLIEPDDAIRPYISYEALTRKIVLAEDPATLSLVSDTQTYPFVIRLVDVRDYDKEYLVSVSIIAPFDPNPEYIVTLSDTGEQEEVVEEAAEVAPSSADGD